MEDFRYHIEDMIEHAKDILRLVGGSILLIMNFVIIYFAFYAFL